MDKTGVLITGINGFIGSNLKNHIKEVKPLWKIYGIDKGIKGSKLEFRLRLEDKRRLKDILLRLKPKYIFHMCGNTTSKDFKELFNSNVYTTFSLLNTIKEINNYSPRLIIPSSAAEYGPMADSRPLKETDPLRPVSVYGFSKSLQTQVSLMFVRHGLDVVIARMFNVLGPAVPVNLCIGKFAHELALIKKGKKRPILYTRILDTKRDFLDIQDVCSCLLSIAIRGEAGEVYNVCRGKSYSIKYLLDKIVEISGVKGLKIIEDKKLEKTDLSDSFGSTHKLKKLISHFKPRPINQSLKSVYAYYSLGG